jgi:hypothetical protein
MSPSMTLRSLIDSIAAILDSTIVTGSAAPYVKLLTVAVHLVEFIVDQYGKSIDADHLAATNEP